MRSHANIRCSNNRGYLNKLRNSVYSDAVDHGLWDDECRLDAAHRIRDEVEELIDAVGDLDHYTEELADVIIMALSTAGYLDIDIHGAVMQKMSINAVRPYRHESELCDCVDCDPDCQFDMWEEG